ncbi:MAG: transglutaminase domain-containing protein, partial [Bdellovibrionales bacterium]|nr:transglutaminase domain-containing protein [Bdellovibrionales bacterium]
EPQLDAQTVVAAPNLRQEAEVPLATSLRNPERIDGLVLELEGVSPTSIPSDLRQTSEWDEQSGRLLVRTGVASGVAPGLSLGTIEPVEQYLEETREYPLSNTRVRRVATELKRRTDNERQMLSQLVRFVGSYLRPSEDAHLTVHEALVGRSGNCKDHARLLTTLARAVGLPAREVTGLVYKRKNQDGAFLSHTWNEVYVDGAWVAVDAMFKRLSIDATYVSFGSGRHGISNLTGSLGRVSFKVLQVSYRET